MQKILIVEDDRNIAKLLKFNLEKEGFSVGTASDGESGMAQLKKLKPDLLILDLMLPKVNGLEICKLVRQETNLPIIILTAKKEETDRVVGLELGADDYITKPFSMRELVARVKAVLRRGKERQADSGVLRIGKLEVDLERYEVKLNHAPLPLTSKEFELLKVFIKSQGKALTREALLESVWKYEQAAEMDTRTVDQHVRRLRQKLGSESARLITIKNVGYRFKLD